MTRVLSKRTVQEYFAENMARLDKGINAVDSGHVMDCRIDRALCAVGRTVQASMKKKSYAVKAFYGDEVITFATCNCPIGSLGQCHHIAAILIYAYRSVSVTDTQCQWVLKKNVGRDNVGLPIDNYYKLKNPGYSAVPGPLAVAETTEAFLQLKNCIGAGVAMHWLLDGEPDPTQLQMVQLSGTLHSNHPPVAIPSVEAAVLSAGFRSAEDKLKYIEEFCGLTENDIATIAEVTEGHVANPKWTEARRHRITASVSGPAIRASTGRRSCVTLLKIMAGVSKPLNGVKAFEWGRANESKGVDILKGLYPDKVIKLTGVWLHSSGLIGASPDALMDDDSIIEVKCPYSMREATSIRDELMTDQYSKYFITFHRNGNYSINTTHDYYHQIQVQLYLTGRSNCCFVLWCPQDAHVVCLPRDPRWSELHIPSILQTYEERYLPFAFPNYL